MCPQCGPGQAPSLLWIDVSYLQRSEEGGELKLDCQGLSCSCFQGEGHVVGESHAKREILEVGLASLESPVLLKY